MSLQNKFLSKELSDKFWKEGLTLSTAESCTAGSIASVITAIPGSSRFYKGGVVGYADEVKILRQPQNFVDPLGGGNGAGKHSHGIRTIQRHLIIISNKAAPAGDAASDHQLVNHETHLLQSNGYLF